MPGQGGGQPRGGQPVAGGGGPPRRHVDDSKNCWNWTGSRERMFFPCSCCPLVGKLVVNRLVTLVTNCFSGTSLQQHVMKAERKSYRVWQVLPLCVYVPNPQFKMCILQFITESVRDVFRRFRVVVLIWSPFWAWSRRWSLEDHKTGGWKMTQQNRSKSFRPELCPLPQARTKYSWKYSFAVSTLYDFSQVNFVATEDIFLITDGFKVWVSVSWFYLCCDANLSHSWEQ